MISPLSGTASVNIDYKNKKYTYDSNVFPRETNKTATIGRFRQKKYQVICDGQGNIDFKYLEHPLKLIEKLAKLRDKKIITDEDFNQAKKKLLDKL